MANRKDPEKSVDVPPTGSRNPDPITDAPGSHPVETGIGAAVGGVATGAAIGSVAGPLGTAIGAAVGAIAGGLAGKGVGELIDPTTEDNWLRENFSSRPYAKGHDYDSYKPAYDYAGETETRYSGKPYHEVESDLQQGWDSTKHAANLTWDKAKHAVKDVFDYRTANRYGGEAYNQYGGRPFAEVENDLKQGWSKTKHAASTTWDQARDAVRDAYDRTFKLHEERLKVGKHSVEAGDVSIRKEVVTENKTVTVPVEREEIVVERHPASGHAASGSISASGSEEVRIPVRREEIDVQKETVVTEEVNVGKRKVQGTEQASGTVRKEELKVDAHGDVKVDDKGGRSSR